MAKANPTTALDYTGQRFGQLVAIEPTDLRAGNNIIWVCLCDCGNKTLVSSSNIGNTKGNTKSCGCLKGKPKHGGTTHNTKSKEYAVWNSMRQRCFNPKNSRYPRYGARGIGISESWNDFGQFIRDMGPCPPGMTIERIDNNKGYSKENCKWATYAEQNRNNCNTRMVTLNGETMCIKDWADRLGIKVVTVNVRIHKGWTPERALTTPLAHKKHHDATAVTSGNTSRSGA